MGITPVFAKEGIQLYNGDCRDVLVDLPEDSIDGFVTDPPYGMNIDYGNDSDQEKNALALVKEVMPMLLRVLKPGAMGFAFGSPRLIHKTVIYGEEAGFRYHRLLWMYKRFRKTFPWRGWKLASDAIAVFSKGAPQKWSGASYCYDTYVYDFSNHELPFTVDFPSVKPLVVVNDLVLKSCPGTIIDPFLGSGTTGVSCVYNRRPFIGVEKTEKTFEIAKWRVENVLKSDKRAPDVYPAKN